MKAAKYNDLTEEGQNMLIHEDIWLKLLTTLIRLAVEIFKPRPETDDDIDTKADGPANEIEVEIDPK